MSTITDKQVDDVVSSTEFSEKNEIFLECYTECMPRFLVEALIGLFGGEAKFEAVSENKYPNDAKGVIESWINEKKLADFYSNNKEAIIAFVLTIVSDLTHNNKIVNELFSVSPEYYTAAKFLERLDKLDGVYSVNEIEVALSDKEAVAHTEVASAVVRFLAQEICTFYERFLVSGEEYDE